MKLFIRIFLFLIPYYCIGQSANDSINKRIEYLIDKKTKIEITKSEKTELLNYGYSIQNRAFIFSENNLDYLKALVPLDSALSFWILTNDSANQANLRKYKGFLLGRLKRFSEAKKEVHQAIKIFKKLNIDSGVAVSQYDMALVFVMEGSLDSALIYQKQATDFWIKKNVSKRIIINNTLLIDLYRSLKNYTKAIEIQRINESLLQTDDYWKTVIDFYYVSYRLFKEVNNTVKADLFKNQYNDKLEELKDKDIQTKSFYDI